jgi:hypothetical protein
VDEAKSRYCASMSAVNSVKRVSIRTVGRVLRLGKLTTPGQGVVKDRQKARPRRRCASQPCRGNPLQARAAFRPPPPRDIRAPSSCRARNPACNRQSLDHPKQRGDSKRRRECGGADEGEPLDCRFPAGGAKHGRHERPSGCLSDGLAPKRKPRRWGSAGATSVNIRSAEGTATRAMAARM